MKNILIVDDDADIRRILIKVLSGAESYQLLSAKDAADARKLMSETTVDLVLTDIEMPGESGLDLAWYIKQQYPETGIVLITVVSDPDKMQRAIEIGLYGYLLKPFDRRQVVITVANALRRQELELQNKKIQRDLESEVHSKSCRLDESVLEIEQKSAELKITNKALQDQLLFMQALLDAIPHPVFYKDLKGRFLGSNEASENFFGLSRNEIVGLKTEDILTGEITQKARVSDFELLHSNSKVAYETGIEDAQGQFHNVIVTKAYYSNTEGNPAGIVGILMDITDKLAMERELLQSQKMASIGQLAAGVAHEINNPTGFVSSNLNTLSEYQEDLKRLIEAYQRLIGNLGKMPTAMVDRPIEHQIAAVEAIEAEIDLPFLLEDVSALIKESSDGTERIKKIVEDLKHFAHPGQDKIQDTDINQGLETTLNIVNNELKYTATVIKELGDLPIIQANPQQLNQVFANILVNAAHAINTNGEIRIQTRHLDEQVEICISDTGCGIPEDHLERIFDPFFTTKEVGKGTGLGMNIAYNIIKKHQGDIQVSSVVGEGTRFTIQLPIFQSDPDDTSDGPSKLKTAKESDHLIVRAGANSPSILKHKSKMVE